MDRCRVRGIERGSASGARHGARRKPKCCHQCGLRWAVPGHGQSTTQGNPVTSALEGVAAKLQEALGDHGGPQMSTGDVSSEAGTTTCGTDGSLSTKEKKEAADELASLEAALSALGATRGTTQIAQELREQIANKKKTLAATKPIGARVDGCRAWAARCKARRDQALEAFRLASAALEKADEEVAQSTRELAVLGRGAGKSAVRTQQRRHQLRLPRSWPDA